MKNKLLVMIFCCHLLVIAARSFNSVRPQYKLITNATIHGLMDTYTAYTALQSDYSFFSPNIGNSAYLNIKVYNGTDSLYVPFDVTTGEIGIRRFTSLNAINTIPEAREFITQSLAAHTLKRYPLASGIIVSYFIQVPSSMGKFSAGKSTIDSLMFQVKYNVDEQ